jgi:hypothetical protein
MKKAKGKYERKDRVQVAARFGPNDIATYSKLCAYAQENGWSLSRAVVVITGKYLSSLPRWRT